MNDELFDMNNYEDGSSINSINSINRHEAMLYLNSEDYLSLPHDER